MVVDPPPPLRLLAVMSHCTDYARHYSGCSVVATGACLYPRCPGWPVRAGEGQDPVLWRLEHLPLCPSGAAWLHWVAPLPDPH